MYHCHILEHEEAGLTGQYVCACKGCKSSCATFDLSQSSDIEIYFSRDCPGFDDKSGR
jgi:hypothetical protein